MSAWLQRQFTVHRKRHLIALSIVATLAILTTYVHKGLRGNDFGAYHAASRAVVHGEDIYDARSDRGRDYLYPPFLAVVAAPMGYLSEDVAACLWIALKLAAFYLALRLMLGMLRREQPGVSWLPLGLGTLALAGPLHIEMGNGQADLFVMLSIVGAAWAWTQRRPGVAGALIAVGTALKATPAFFLVYFLAKRSGRAVAGFAVGALATFLLIPALGLGFDGAVAANQRWYEMMAHPYAEGRGYLEPSAEAELAVVPPYNGGTTLHPVLHNTLQPARIHNDLDAPRVAFAELPPALVSGLWVGLGALLTLFAVLRLDRRRPDRGRADAGSPEAAAMEAGFGTSALRDFAMFAALMVLLAPVSRKAHLASLLPATCWLAMRWKVLHDRVAGRVLGLTFVATSVVIWVVPRTWKHYWVALGGYLLAVTVVFVLLALRARRGAPRSDVLDPAATTAG